MKCPECFRRFRSATAEELYRRRKAVIADLELSRDEARAADKQSRHRIEHNHFHKHGEKIAA